MTAQLLQWRPPKVSPSQNINIIIPCQKLSITSRRPRFKVSDRERDAAMNRARVNRHYQRCSGKEKKFVSYVEVEGFILDGLVYWELLREDRTSDKAAVQKAIQNLLNIVTRNRPKNIF